MQVINPYGAKSHANQQSWVSY